MNVKDKDSYSPLHWAAINGHLELIKYLAETPLDVARRAQVNGYSKVVISKNVKPVFESIMKPWKRLKQKEKTPCGKKPHPHPINIPKTRYGPRIPKGGTLGSIQNAMKKGEIMAFNFENIKTVTPTTETKPKAELPTKMVEFANGLHENKARITYTAWHAICQAEGLSSPTAQVNSSLRHLSGLPQAMQYLICRKNGGYHEKALAKWSDKAPEGFQNFGLVPDEEAVALYNSGE